jgi:hypothetical protein
MRKAIGLGLLGIVGLVACGSSDDGAAASIDDDPGRNGQVGSSTDPTDPAPVAPPSTSAPTPSAPPPAEVPPAPVVRGLSITDLAVFQGVKVPVMKAGALVKATERNAPVVANRPGMLRVYVSPEAGWTPRAVTAELRLASGTTKFPILRDTKVISAASKEEEPKSTFDLEFPADSVPADATFQVSLTVPDGEDPEAVGATKARFPEDGTTTDLGAALSGKLRMVVVPVRYDADGSGRTPTVTGAQKLLYQQTLLKMYPTSEIEVTAHEPMPFASKISSNGGGYPAVLRAITDLRQKDDVDKDVYYYGLLEPAATWESYCGRGCVTGLSSIVDDADSAAMRASVGVGFDGQIAANTMAHEVGHAHGRLHAPCGGPASPDPRFPYQGGGIGVWGYDILAKTLISPSKGTDVMGYCPNVWVSDYTYDALFNRIVAVSGQKGADSSSPQSSGPKKSGQFRVATVDGNDELSWDGDITINDARDLRGGKSRQARFMTAAGAQALTREAKFFAFDHLPGGFLFVPKDEAVDATRWKTVEIDGFARALER